jgi:hypothetical protein
VAENCTICNKEYSPLCDYKQGRCPHHPPMINIQPKDTSKGHFYVSMVKSAIRIVAGGCLVTGNLLMAGVCFIMAEVLGIVEELV